MIFNFSKIRIFGCFKGFWRSNWTSKTSFKVCLITINALPVKKSMKNAFLDFHHHHHPYDDHHHDPDHSPDGVPHLGPAAGRGGAQAVPLTPARRHGAGPGAAISRYYLLHQKYFYCILLSVSFNRSHLTFLRLITSWSWQHKKMKANINELGWFRKNISVNTMM